MLRLKRDEISGQFKILCKEGLFNSHRSANIVKIMKCRRLQTVDCVLLWGNLIRNLPFGRSRRKSEDSIKMDLTWIPGSELCPVVSFAVSDL
jgi:hypothetical protein